MSRKFIDIKKMRYTVKKLRYDKKLKRGYAYIIDDKYVLPYKGEYHSIEDCRTEGVGIYYCKKEEDIILVRPFGKKKQKKYSVDKIYELDKDYINNLIEQEGITSDLDDDLLELDPGNAFAPPINETDNICQKIIKDALARKQIDLKAYLNRFGTPTNMGNYKRSLLQHGLQTDRFLDWLDILDVDVEITYKDKDGCRNPMGSGTFSSKDLK